MRGKSKGRILFLEQDSVVGETSGVTTSRRVLSVFADSTTAELGVASQLPRFSKSGCLFSFEIKRETVFPWKTQHKRKTGSQAGREGDYH